MQALQEDSASWSVLKMLSETTEKNLLWAGAQGHFQSALHQHSHGSHLLKKHRVTTSLLGIYVSRGEWWRETLLGVLFTARSFGLCKLGPFIANCQST